MKQYKDIKCPQCGSVTKYKRQKTKEWVCHRCSTAWKEKEEEGEGS